MVCPKIFLAGPSYRSGWPTRLAPTITAGGGGAALGPLLTTMTFRLAARALPLSGTALERIGQHAEAAQTLFRSCHSFVADTAVRLRSSHACSSVTTKRPKPRLAANGADGWRISLRASEPPSKCPGPRFFWRPCLEAADPAHRIDSAER